MTSVNVDSDRARQERRALLEIAGEVDVGMTDGSRLLVCGGHGAVSTLEGKELRTFGKVLTYDVAEHYQVK
jgi:hypothetical protein